MADEPPLEEAINLSLEGIKKGFAVVGQAEEMEYHLRCLIAYVGEKKGDVSPNGDFIKRVNEVRKSGLDVAIDMGLGDLERYADSFGARAVDSYLPKILDLAEAVQFYDSLGIKADKNLIEETKRICTTAYQKAIPEELKTAAGYALQGKPGEMEMCLTLAQRYASRVGMEITEQVKEVQALIPKSP